MQAISDAIATMPSPISMPSSIGHKASREEIERTAKDFESVFMAQMIKPMWDGIETDGMFGGGPGEDAVRQMILQEYGKSMAESSGYTMSKDIMTEMIRMQNQANGIKG